MPLDTEIPAFMILQCHRLNHTVGRVRRRNKTGSECGNALMVVTRDGGAAPDDLAQRGRLIDIKIMNPVAVVAHGVIHVLDKITTERDIDDLIAPADRQQWQPIRKGNASDRNVEGVLLLIYPVLGRVRLLAGPAGRYISAAGQQYPVGKPDPLSSCIDVHFKIRRVRVHDNRLAACREDRLDERSGGHLSSVTQGRRLLGVAGRNQDQRATGRGEAVSHNASKWF